MAAFDTPLTTLLTPSKPPRQATYSSPSNSMAPKSEPKSTIQAQFPPGQQPVGTTSPVLPDTKTNLLDSTPPQIVRALGQAEPLVRGLNVVLGLLTWSSGQDWLSFFLVVGWWVVCLYGPLIVKFVGNFIPVVCIAVWYLLQKTVETPPERTSTHASLTATLKEIDTLRTRIAMFLTPPSLLLPHLALPASQPLLVRLCLAWPIWLLITHKILPPSKIMLALGTSVLCWSAPWARVICIALWRSRTVRKYSGLIIGQDLMEEIHQPNTVTVDAHATTTTAPKAEGRRARHKPATSTGSIREVLGGGVRITQTLYQSQRRWIGIGWTSNLFPNERSAWADETEHPAVSIDEFNLPPDKSLPHTYPSGEKGLRVAKWKWLDPEWKPVVKPNETDSEGWIYTDNTWKNPGPTEAFGKYTRRRKFLRTSELTEEIIPATQPSQTTSPRASLDAPPIVREGTPKSSSPQVQLHPTSAMKVPERNVSPEAVRPDGTRGTGIERDIRDAVGLGIEGGNVASSTTSAGKGGDAGGGSSSIGSGGEREFGTGS